MNDALIEAIGMTTDIVSAYLSNSANPIQANEIPCLIGSVHSAISGLMAGVPVANAATTPTEPQKPAVPIKRSVTPDYIVCLEDGKKLKMLKRYLAATYKLTPEQYRAKWGLPDDYPMVAPAYSERRSELARAIGLGTKKAA